MPTQTYTHSIFHANVNSLYKGTNSYRYSDHDLLPDLKHNIQSHSISSLVDTRLNIDGHNKLSATFKNRHHIFASSSKGIIKNKRADVALIISKDVVNKILHHEYDSPPEGQGCRLIAVVYKDLILSSTVLAISYYIPPDQHKVTILKQVFTVMEKNILLFNPSHIIMASDSNVHLDSIPTRSTKIINEHLYRHSLADTYRFLNPDIQSSNGTTFPPRTNTLNSPTRIDYIFISKALLQDTDSSFEIIPSYTINSDHNGISFRYKPAEMPAKQYKFKDELLKIPAFKNQLKNQIKRYISNINNEDQIEDENQNLESMVEQLPEEYKTFEGLFSIFEETVKPLDLSFRHSQRLARKNKYISLDKKYNQILSKKEITPKDRQEMDNITKKRKYIIESKGYINHINNIKKSLENGHAPTPQFFRGLRQNNQANTTKQLEINGVVTDDQQKIKNHVKDHYQQILEHQPPELQINHSLPDLLQKHRVTIPKISSESSSILQTPITDSHIAEAIKLLKKDSSPGPDGYTARLIIHIYQIIPTLYHQAIRKELNTEMNNTTTLTHALRRRKLVFIKKKTDRKTIKCLRPLSLLSVFYKILSNLLAIQLRGTIIKDNIIPQNMTAYCPGRGPSDAIRTLMDIIQNAQHNKKMIHITSIDFEGAYDSVNRAYIFEVLGLMNFPPEFTSKLKKLFKAHTVELWLNSSPIGILKHLNGLGQGDPLASLLYLIGALPVTLATQQSPSLKGYTIQDKTQTSSSSSLPNTNIKSITYADDSILFMETIEEVGEALQIYKDFSPVSGLINNVAKTAVTTNHPITPTKEDILSSWGIRKENIGNKITFLGHEIEVASNNTEQPDITAIINKIETKLNNTITHMSKFFHNCVSRSIVMKAYLNSAINYLVLPHQIPKKLLQKTQSILDSYTTNKRAFTSGKQRYLNLDRAGMGGTNIHRHLTSISTSWISKLIKGENIASNTPRQAIENIGFPPDLLLWAADWELKILANLLNHKYGLSFWSKLLLNIIEIRNALNTEINKSTEHTEKTTEVRTGIATRITSKSKEHPNLKPLKGAPTLFDKEWIPFLIEHPCKINLLTKDRKLKQFNLPQDKIEHLEKIIEDHNTRNPNTSHKEAQPDFLIMTLASNTKQSIATRTYNSLTASDTQNKSNFSATSKWEKLGFNYNRNTIETAAKTIKNLRVPGITKACLNKHNLCGYIQPAVLAKLKFRDDASCNACKEPKATYQHLLYECPLATFLRQQLQLHIRTVHKLPNTPNINIHNTMILSKEGTLGGPKVTETTITLIALLKHQIHKHYHLKTNLQEPNDESRALNIYNEAISIAKIKNPKMRAFKKIKTRQDDPDRPTGISESLLSHHLRLYPTTQPQNKENLPPQEQTDPIEDIQFIAGLITMTKNEGLELTPHQKAFLDMYAAQNFQPP